MLKNVTCSCCINNWVFVCLRLYKFEKKCDFNYCMIFALCHTVTNMNCHLKCAREQKVRFFVNTLIYSYTWTI